MQGRLPRIEVIDDETARIMRRLTGAQKLRMASDMLESARRMLMHHLRVTHPDWDDLAVAREAARRLSHESE